MICEIRIWLTENVFSVRFLRSSRFGRFVLRHGTRYARRRRSYFRLRCESCFNPAPPFDASVKLGTDYEVDAINLHRPPKDPFFSLLPSA